MCVCIAPGPSFKASGATAMLFLSLIGLLALPSVRADIISDITTSEADEDRALQVKMENFWTPVLQAAENVNLEKHLQLYEDAEKIIESLPPQNYYVREALQESLIRLKQADAALFKQTLRSKQVASEKLSEKPTVGLTGLSFLTGGQNFLRAALSKLSDGGKYSERLVKHIEQRQADITPLLRGAAESTGSILSDCRLASKRGFDVRKYDIYNRGVAKTPKEADDVADRLIDAAGETRHLFTHGIIEAVNGLTRDVRSRQEDPSVVVTRASLHTSLKAAVDVPGQQQEPLLTVTSASDRKSVV